MTPVTDLTAYRTRRAATRRGHPAGTRRHPRDTAWLRLPAGRVTHLPVHADTTTILFACGTNRPLHTTPLTTDPNTPRCQRCTATTREP